MLAACSTRRDQLALSGYYDLGLRVGQTLGLKLGDLDGYNRVGGRSAVLTAVAEQALEESRGYLDPAYEAERDTEERILLVAAAYARFGRERPHEFRILVEPPTSPMPLNASPNSCVAKTPGSQP